MTSEPLVPRILSLPLVPTIVGVRPKQVPAAGVGLGLGEAVGLGEGDAVGLGEGDAVGDGEGDGVEVEMATATTQSLALVVNTVMTRSPSPCTTRDATHGSGEAVPAGPLQSATRTPFRKTSTSAGLMEPSAEASISNVMTKGFEAFEALGALICTV
jgi:hypothetical protein